VASPPPALASGGNDRASEDLLQLAGNPFANMLNGKWLYCVLGEIITMTLYLDYVFFAVLMRYTEYDMPGLYRHIRYLSFQEYCRSALIIVSWTRIRIENADSDPEPIGAKKLKKQINDLTFCKFSFEG
jgi:hypothetical protein